VVTDSVLAADGPAYKALIIYNQTQITPSASAALINFAAGGLPIYIVGAVPNTTVGATSQQEVSTNIAKLLEYESVHIWSVEDFSASTLVADGVPARASISGGSDISRLFTFWTSDAERNSEYIYFYNTGADATFNVSFAVSPFSKPFIMDAWTGKRTPIALFDFTSNGIITEIRLKSNQTTILAFQLSQEGDCGTHAVAHSANVDTVRFGDAGTLEAWVKDSSEAWVTLSNGIQVTMPATNSSDSQVSTLGPWDLTIEAVGPSAGNDLEGETTTIDIGRLEHLTSWTEIAAIQNASGLGTYTTQFEWTRNDQTAVIISFGPVLNTLKAWINGRQIPPVDPANPVADISSFVEDETNEIRIEVTTTLFNAVKANVDRVFSIGYGPQTPAYYIEEDWQESGLIGPVEIRTLTKVALT
jgi:hypothetical protein